MAPRCIRNSTSTFSSLSLIASLASFNCQNTKQVQIYQKKILSQMNFHIHLGPSLTQRSSLDDENFYSANCLTVLAVSDVLSFFSSCYCIIVRAAYTPYILEF
jgi:hypothetical protein